MIPAGVNIEDLAHQLREDQVAYDNAVLAADHALNADVASVLPAGSGLAVVDTLPRSAADVRDIAQELLNESGLHTVIVQSPFGVQAVSEDYSRATLEHAMNLVPVGIGQREVVEQFFAGVDSVTAHAFLWPLAVVAAVIVVALCALGTYRSFVLREAN